MFKLSLEGWAAGKRCRLLALLVALTVSLPDSTLAQAPPWPPGDDQTRANVAAAFKRLSEGRFVEHVEQNFAPDATLIISGPRESAGTFRGRAEIILGLRRLFVVVPSHKFRIHEVWVTTTPGEVTAAAAWSDDAQLPDGTALPSNGMNRIRVGPRGVIEEQIFILPDNATFKLP